MVAEDDPGFARFWAAYPWRIAKLDARKAWAQLNPASELIDRMITTLAWQTRLWEQQGYGTPYPATWIRGERWKDERPASVGIRPKGRTADNVPALQAFVNRGPK
jgi:hypothetical protein